MNYESTFLRICYFFCEHLENYTWIILCNCRFLLSNPPGDYAWGREGLDTIVTQLLNQMDSSGPPPLSTDKIDAIPFVVVTDAQVCKYPRFFLLELLEI